VAGHVAAVAVAHTGSATLPACRTAVRVVALVHSVDGAAIRDGVHSATVGWRVRVAAGRIPCDDVPDCGFPGVPAEIELHPTGG